MNSTMQAMLVERPRDLVNPEKGRGTSAGSDVGGVQKNAGGDSEEKNGQLVPR